MSGAPGPPQPRRDPLCWALAAAGSGSDTEEEFVLWNLRCTFRASRVVSLWVRGENLLAQRYEINAGFPMPRATVMAGLNLHM